MCAICASANVRAVRRRSGDRHTPFIIVDTQARLMLRIGARASPLFFGWREKAYGLRLTTQPVAFILPESILTLLFLC